MWGSSDHYETTRKVNRNGMSSVRIREVTKEYKIHC